MSNRDICLDSSIAFFFFDDVVDDADDADDADDDADSGGGADVAFRSAEGISLLSDEENAFIRRSITSNLKYNATGL